MALKKKKKTSFCGGNNVPSPQPDGSVPPPSPLNKTNPTNSQHPFSHRCVPAAPGEMTGRNGGKSTTIPTKGTWNTPFHAHKNLRKTMRSTIETLRVRGCVPNIKF